MPTQLQFRRGTTAQNNAFTGVVGEISIDTNTDNIRVHDGSQAGGFEIIPSGTILFCEKKNLYTCIYIIIIIYNYLHTKYGQELNF